MSVSLFSFSFSFLSKRLRDDWTEYVEPSHDVDISLILPFKKKKKKSLRLPCDKYFISLLSMFASTSTFETDRTLVGEHSTQLTHISFL